MKHGFKEAETIAGRDGIALAILEGSRGFQPTEQMPLIEIRRVATFEPVHRGLKCRYATQPHSDMDFRGLKPTATFKHGYAMLPNHIRVPSVVHQWLKTSWR